MKISARLHLALRLVILFLAAQSLAAPGLATAPQTPDTYPQTADGLKAQLNALLASHADPTLQQKLIEQLRIPDHKRWFLDTFGPTEGSRLEEKYTQKESAFVGNKQKWLEQLLKEPLGPLEIIEYNKPSDPPSKLYQVALEDMARIATIYHATAGQYLLGDYVYVSGSFRLLETQLLTELSNAPPMRVRVGGNVQAKRLYKKVTPLYPEEARKNHIQGTVGLHAVIGTDGSIITLNVVNGPTELADSAMDAVKQWKYEPTLLNGKPVEVETAIEVIYSLAP